MDEKNTNIGGPEINPHSEFSEKYENLPMLEKMLKPEQKTKIKKSPLNIETKPIISLKDKIYNSKDISYKLEISYHLVRAPVNGKITHQETISFIVGKIISKKLEIPIKIYEKFLLVRSEYKKLTKMNKNQIFEYIKNNYFNEINKIASEKIITGAKEAINEKLINYN